MSRSSFNLDSIGVDVVVKVNDKNIYGNVGKIKSETNLPCQIEAKIEIVQLYLSIIDYNSVYILEDVSIDLQYYQDD